MTEEELQKQITCVMRDTPADPLGRPALAVLHWATLKRLDAIIVRPEELRKRFLEEWNTDWGEKKREGRAYWRGPRAAAAFGRRLFMLFLKHTVIQSFEPYILDLNGVTVTGQVALLGKEDNRGRLHMYALSPRLQIARDRRAPDYVALARWLAMRRHVDTVDLTLINQSLVFGESYCDKTLRETLIQRWLESIVREQHILVRPPIPGAYCRGCSHPCSKTAGFAS